MLDRPFSAMTRTLIDDSAIVCHNGRFTKETADSISVPTKSMPKPVLQSLILADHVYEDKLTGKRIIAGVFNRIIRGVRVIKQMGPPAPPPAPAPQYIPPPVQNLAPPPAPL